MKLLVNKKAVGARIKQLRLSKGMTLEEFGKLFSAEKTSVLGWENGRSLPNKERIKQISKIADISINELLYGAIDEFISVNANNIYNYINDTDNEPFPSPEAHFIFSEFLDYFIQRTDLNINSIDFLQSLIDEHIKKGSAYWVECKEMYDIEALKADAARREAIKAKTKKADIIFDLFKYLKDDDKDEVLKYTSLILKNYKLSEKEKYEIGDIISRLSEN